MKRKIKRLELSNGQILFDPTDKEVTDNNDQILSVAYEYILSKEEYNNMLAHKDELEKFMERWKNPVEAIKLTILGNCGVLHTFEEWTRCRACDTPKPTVYETFNR